jgi:hypothetical protein
MKTKSERKNEIKKLERKALKLFKSGTRGPEVNKMLDKVIALEDAYEKDFGINPGNYFPKARKKREKKSYEPDLWE